MAKKSDETVDFSTLDSTAKEKLLNKAFAQLDECNPDAVMLDKAQSNIESFEDTGCYILNALLSGELKGGFPEGRLSILRR